MKIINGDSYANGMAATKVINGSGATGTASINSKKPSIRKHVGV